MIDLLTLDRTVEVLQRELIEATTGQPWKTLALIRMRDGRFVFKYDLGRALTDPEFLGFCSLTTTQEQLRAMILEEAEA